MTESKYLKNYSDFLKKKIEVSGFLKIVCDASNGTAGIVLKEVFKNHPYIKLVLVNEKPDGRFPAHGPNPLAKGALDQARKLVKKEKADFGAVFDADGDRVFFIDDKGNSLPSFVTALVLFKFSQPPFVADELIFQTLVAGKSISSKKLFPSKVGSFFVKQEMKKQKASVSAEYSGHFYFKDFFYCDSGVLALVKMCNIISSSKQKLSDFVEENSEIIVLADQVKISDDDSDWQEKILNDSNFKKKKITFRDGVTISLPQGFLNIRASNTEPLLRITCGAKSKKAGESFINKVLKIFKK